MPQFTQQTLSLSWVKCQNNAWCGLNTVNLESDHFDGMEGVYVIWRNTDGHAVRVGQGVIKDRLAAHREDQTVQVYAAAGLSVSWAPVAARYRDGVETFLAVQLKPLVGDRFPDVPPIRVNLPE